MRQARYWIWALVLLTLASTAHAQSEREAVWLLPIDTEITPATAEFVASRVAEANERQPLALIVYLDTPGGRVSSMERIVDTLLNEARVPTIAVVERALSAGALIAMSAEQLVMLPGSSIGAALPVALSPGGATAVDEKYTSAVRGQFRAVAEARGRNARVAEAMVDERIEIPGLASSSELVTLTGSQAVEHGIADLQASSLNEALEQLGYGGARVVTLERTPAERLGTLLANPIASALLLAVGIGGILLELFTPGLGVPGGIGLLALGLLAASAYVATPATSLDVVLVVVGVLLLVAELLVIPGFGVAGVLGLGAIVFAVFRMFQEQTLTVLGWAVLFGASLVGLGLWLLPNARFASPLQLRTRLAGGVANLDSVVVHNPLEHLVGQQGVAASDLRPAGLARIGGERVDVVSQGDFVAAGSAIEVLRVEGSRVTVRQLEQ